jgi:hypothetical protein
MLDRADYLRRFPFRWPVLSAAMLAGVLRWAMAIVALAGAVWLVDGLIRQWTRRAPEEETTETPAVSQ